MSDGAKKERTRGRLKAMAAASVVGPGFFMRGRAPSPQLDPLPEEVKSKAAKAAIEKAQAKRARRAQIAQARARANP